MRYVHFDAHRIELAALGDRSWLLILNALLPGPQCVEELSAPLGLGASTMSFHLHKLVRGGLVAARKDQYYSVYSLRPEIFTMSLGDMIAFDNPHRPQQSIRLVRRLLIDDGYMVRSDGRYRLTEGLVPSFRRTQQRGHLRRRDHRE